MIVDHPQSETAERPSGSVLRAKMPELDALRGIACLMVLFFHGFGNRYVPEHLNAIERLFVHACGYGFTGVNLFFVLSGFLITGILLETRQRPDYYRRFYIRRALRILPLYYGVLVLLVVVSKAGLTDRPLSWAFVGLSAVYLANTTPLLGVPLQYGVLWSLAVEEHFYLLWPTFVRRLKTRHLKMFAFAVCLAALAFRIAAFHLGYNVFGFYTWMVCDGLAMGALLAIGVRGHLPGRTALWRIAELTLLYAMACFFVEKLVGARLTGAALQISGINAFFTFTLAGVLLLGSRYGIRSRILEFVGAISYGVYLVHTLIFDVFDAMARRHFPSLAPEHLNFLPATVRFCLVAAATLAIAWLSRWYFEDRFLRLKDHFASDHPLMRDSGIEPIPDEAAGITAA